MRGHRRGGAFSLVALAVVAGSAILARGQSIAPGSSPGRASYRPPSQWNNGPYFTTSHVDPYAPVTAERTSLYSSKPSDFPWSNGPQGLYSTFYPGRVALYPYDQGFSPYSGFAGWYQQEYGVRPTRENVLRARAAFFRSAPSPPPGVLPPLPPPTAPAAQSPQARDRARATPVKVVVPGRAGVRGRPRQVPIYRSSQAGQT